MLLAVLTLVSGSASVELPGANVSISISEAFVFTAVLLFGPAAGTLTVALDGLVLSLWIARRRPELHRALFNVAAPSLSAWLSAHLFFRLSHLSPLSERPATLNEILPSLVVFALAYFALNSWLIAIVIAFQRRMNPFSVWSSNFLWLSLNYFCGASVAVLMVTYTRSLDLRFVGVVVPLLFVLYFTFKTSMQRVEDANRHVEQMNTLYLSTIETLAMAIDAKDQVTHGHIRRVQTYATHLATAVGVRDEGLLKAIEAAALLHDMGKLAVPEYILNKPGKLTDAEFASMKLHATVGADILSAVDFPYPVVPIVRHHHENWDGTGYPDGLKTTDIPIGARILSVVDCFDALTSDRPYRPRLTDDEALGILRDRRGSMYDPLIVDTFLRVYSTVKTTVDVGQIPQRALDDIATARKATALTKLTQPVLKRGASRRSALLHNELAQSLAGQVSLREAGHSVVNSVHHLMPFSLCALYLPIEDSNDIEVLFSVGEGADLVKGLRVRIGEKLSGWVAANRQTIMNSNPAIDLGHLAGSQLLSMKSCISTALETANHDLLGVLTVYAKEDNVFDEEHRLDIETIAREIADALSRDAATSLPRVRFFARFRSAVRLW